MTKRKLGLTVFVLGMLLLFFSAPLAMNFFAERAVIKILQASADQSGLTFSIQGSRRHWLSSELDIALEPQNPPQSFSAPSHLFLLNLHFTAGPVIWNSRTHSLMLGKSLILSTVNPSDIQTALQQYFSKAYPMFKGETFVHFDNRTETQFDGFAIHYHENALSIDWGGIHGILSTNSSFDHMEQHLQFDAAKVSTPEGWVLQSDAITSDTISDKKLRGIWLANVSLQLPALLITAQGENRVTLKNLKLSNRQFLSVEKNLSQDSQLSIQSIALLAMKSASVDAAVSIDHINPDFTHALKQQVTPYLLLANPRLWISALKAPRSTENPGIQLKSLLIETETGNILANGALHLHPASSSNGANQWTHFLDGHFYFQMPETFAKSLYIYLSNLHAEHLRSKNQLTDEQLQTIQANLPTQADEHLNRWVKVNFLVLENNLISSDFSLKNGILTINNQVKIPLATS